ncbi:MAG: hypothetical protein KC457_35370 [Myxococcales bacterium]|nr:hypothetical protein [Myxococcales bacterium]
MVDRYETKYSSAPRGDLGALEAVEFNSERWGGYIHFWSSGHVAFELVDCSTGTQIIDDTMIDWDSSSKDFNEILAPLLERLGP